MERTRELRQLPPQILRRSRPAILCAILGIAGPLLAACGNTSPTFGGGNDWSRSVQHALPDAEGSATTSVDGALAGNRAASQAGSHASPPVAAAVATAAAGPGAWPTYTYRNSEAERRDLAPRRGGGYRKIGKPYVIAGRTYYPKEDPDYVEEGEASWYGEAFHAKSTANGETYDMEALTAAHRTLPLPSLVHVTNLENGRTILVRVNDRGPFKKDRIIDVSARVARELGFQHKGVARVRVKYVGPAPLDGSDRAEQTYLTGKRG